MHSITVIMSTLMAISSNATKVIPGDRLMEMERSKQKPRPFNLRAPVRRSIPTSVRPISAGSMGNVYRVESPNPTDRYAVVKEFPKTKRGIANCDLERAILEEIASYEATKGTRLQISHIHKGYPMVSSRLMLEYIDGKDLKKEAFTEYWDSMSRFVDTIMSPLMRQISDVLEGVHSAYIYHQDIKPANILFVPTPNPKFYLIDFGLAFSLSNTDGPEFGVQYVWGTLRFMSPYHLHLMREQPWSKSAYPADSIREAAGKADYYSLAITAIKTVAHYCKVSARDDPLCEMAQGLISLQNDWGDYERNFFKMGLDGLDGILRPFWNQVEQRISSFREQYPKLHPTLMERLAEWTSLEEFSWARRRTVGFKMRS